jgi:hypothetical protein
MEIAGRVAAIPAEAPSLFRNERLSIPFFCFLDFMKSPRFFYYKDQIACTTGPSKKLM